MKNVKLSHYKLGQALQALRVQQDEARRISGHPDNQDMKVVRLSDLHTDRPYPTGDVPGTLFC